MNRLGRILDLWRRNDGLFPNLSEAVPYVTINAPPSQFALRPKCLMAGPESIQAKVAGSVDPGVLTSVFVDSRPDRGSSIADGHRYALDSFQPLITKEHFFVQNKAEVEFQRLILPAKTPQGAFLMMTYSWPLLIH